MELLAIISAIVPKFFVPLPNAVLALLATIYLIVASAFIPTSQGTGMWLMATVFYAPGIFIALWLIYAIIDGVKGTIKWIGAKRS